MTIPARLIISVLLVAVTLSGCSNRATGPASVVATSATQNRLADKIQFLENYVTFRRQYEELDYDIMYQNNGGGMVPGPSDWDIRLIAVVPIAEIEESVLDGVKKLEGSPPDWVKNLPGSIDRTGLTEWYNKGGTTIGVDRERSIVVYRYTSTPD
ncbi:MAG: hypothetical protein KF851_14735 [Pirellulaceae bacterium]|jgi:hypothetical protein|nr:hypothetical protein [Pirellulaceae bacterium]